VIIFSFPHPLNGNGPSRPITRLWEAAHAAWGDRVLRVVPEDLPELSDTARLGDAIGPCFDDLARERILSHHLSNTDGHVFIGGGAFLNQARFLKTSAVGTGGAVVVSTWYSSYAEHAAKVLADEYRRWGIERTPIHPYLIWRAKMEQGISDTVIVPSEFCKSTYPKETREKARVVEFGVDLDEFKPDMEAKPSPGLHVLIPATNPPRKGLAYASDAVDHLAHRDIRVTLTGSGQVGKLYTKDRLIQIGDALGWVGNAEMRRLYQTSSVALFPSIEEGQCLSALESMASGTPVIVTPECGHVITDGKEGFIVPSRDPAAIQKALQYFIDNPSEVARMGREARAYAERRPWSRFQAEFVRVVEEAAT